MQTKLLDSLLEDTENSQITVRKHTIDKYMLVGHGMVVGMRAG